MTKSGTALVLFVVISFIFTNCKNEPETVKKESEKIKRSVDSVYAGWNSAEGEKISFRYPSNWVEKTKKLDANTTAFGLIEDIDSSKLDGYAALEIYEMDTRGLPFKEFKFGAAHWLNKRFSNKIMVRNTEDISFKGAEARRFEADMPVKGVTIEIDMYAVNGISKYYLLVYFKDGRSDTAVKGIMNSILLYK